MGQHSLEFTPKKLVHILPRTHKLVQQTDLFLLFLISIKMDAKNTAESTGSVCDGKYWIMNPPTIGVTIWATLFSELLTPSSVAVSCCVTLFVSLLVNIGLLTPVPYARKIRGTKTIRYSVDNAMVSIDIVIAIVPVTRVRFSFRARRMRAIKTVCMITLSTPIHAM